MGDEELMTIYEERSAADGRDMDCTGGGVLDDKEGWEGKRAGGDKLCCRGEGGVLVTGRNGGNGGV